MIVLINETRTTNLRIHNQIFNSCIVFLSLQVRKSECSLLVRTCPDSGGDYCQGTGTVWSVHNLQMEGCLTFCKSAWAYGNGKSEMYFLELNLREIEELVDNCELRN